MYVGMYVESVILGVYGYASVDAAEVLFLKVGGDICYDPFLLFLFLFLFFYVVVIC